MMSFTFCPLSASTSHCTVSWFCVTVCTALFYSLFNVCQYLTQYCLLVLCHCDHCCLLRSVHWLSLPHKVRSLGYVTLNPLLSSTVGPMPVSTLQCAACQLSVSTSHWTISFFCVTVYNNVSYSCPKSVSTSQNTACWFCVTESIAVFYSLSSVTLYSVLVLWY